MRKRECERERKRENELLHEKRTRKHDANWYTRIITQKLVTYRDTGVSKNFIIDNLEFMINSLVQIL